MTHILVDTTNMFFRAKHVVRGEDLDTKVGMAMHIMFASVNKVWREFEGKHVVFCFELVLARLSNFEFLPPVSAPSLFQVSRFGCLFYSQLLLRGRIFPFAR